MIDECHRFLWCACASLDPSSNPDPDPQTPIDPPSKIIKMSVIHGRTDTCKMQNAQRQTCSLLSALQLKQLQHSPQLILSSSTL